jgi:hypothetical protein
MAPTGIPYRKPSTVRRIHIRPGRLGIRQTSSLLSPPPSSSANSSKRPTNTSCPRRRPLRTSLPTLLMPDELSYVQIAPAGPNCCSRIITVRQGHASKGIETNLPYRSNMEFGRDQRASDSELQKLGHRPGEDPSRRPENEKSDIQRITLGDGLVGSPESSYKSPPHELEVDHALARPRAGSAPTAHALVDAGCRPITLLLEFRAGGSTSLTRFFSE